MQNCTSKDDSVDSQKSSIPQVTSNSPKIIARKQELLAYQNLLREAEDFRTRYGFSDKDYNDKEVRKYVAKQLRISK